MELVGGAPDVVAAAQDGPGAVGEGLAAGGGRGADVGAGPAGRAGGHDERATRLSRVDRERWILAHVRAVGSIEPRVCVAALDVDRKMARADLRALAERGLVQAQGATTDRRYVLRPGAL